MSSRDIDSKDLLLFFQCARIPTYIKVQFSHVPVGKNQYIFHPPKAKLFKEAKFFINIFTYLR